jgi:NADPH2 dehydrogenase
LRSGDPAFDADGREVFLDQIASLPVDYVDLSSGFYEIDKRLIYPRSRQS